jgi:hypothetical protein
MTTPAIRDAMALFTLVDSPADPTELQWFDISHAVSDQSYATVEPLMTYRPPFAKSIVVYRGKSKSYELYDMMMIVAGDDPEEGIIVTMWKGPYGQRPRVLPSMVYLVDGTMLRYGPSTDDGEPVEKGDANLMLAMVGAWYSALSTGAEAHTPYIKPTFTNKRKIAAGKAPTYDWRTVIIGAKSAKGESKGGTHASPREHDRRGHLRRLRTGKNVWVKPCKVGSAALGSVFHDYEVRAA